MSTLSEHTFSDRINMIDALTSTVTDIIQHGLNHDPQVTLLLSGGTTPAPLYEKLSTTDLAWQNVDVALTDERWVDTDSPDSNEKLLREQLLVKMASYARLTGMRTHHTTPEEGQPQCDARYQMLSKPYHLCLLGMGSDGHTASLFPNATGLEQGLASQQNCVAINAVESEVTGKNTLRMTMTRWAILQSQQLILLITGEEKWAVYQQAKQQPPSQEMPISFFLHQQTVPLSVYWAP